jgi:hypothetical protein
MFEDHVFTTFSAKTVLFVTHIGPSPDALHQVYDHLLHLSMCMSPIVIDSLIGPLAIHLKLIYIFRARIRKAPKLQALLL